jgi:asparagine N-glycosylation enzyme membrane subunit Stt3
MSEEKLRHRGFFLVPAGILIGLGIGMILGYQISGLIIGLGTGFLLSIARRREPQPAFQGSTGVKTRPDVAHLVLVIIALYIIFSGIAIIWVPRTRWPYISAVFLILAGIWVVSRGYYRS